MSKKQWINPASSNLKVLETRAEGQCPIVLGRHTFPDGTCGNYCRVCGGCISYQGQEGVQATCPYNQEIAIEICTCVSGS